MPVWCPQVSYWTKLKVLKNWAQYLGRKNCFGRSSKVMRRYACQNEISFKINQFCNYSNLPAIALKLAQQCENVCCLLAAFWWHQEVFDAGAPIPGICRFPDGYDDSANWSSPDDWIHRTYYRRAVLWLPYLGGCSEPVHNVFGLLCADGDDCSH